MTSGDAAADGRRRVSSGGPWEARYGYSRAIVVGSACWVAGTTDAGPDGHSLHPDDPAAQTRAVLEIIERALADVGFSLRDVVRSRMCVTRLEDVDPVATAHGAVFGEVRPAATLVIVAGLIDPSLLVEIEVDAVRG